MQLDLNKPWTSIKFHTSAIIEESKILDENLIMEVELSRDIKIEGKGVCMKVLDPPEALRMKAEL